VVLAELLQEQEQEQLQEQQGDGGVVEAADGGVAIE
jgi:hypothetical protein